MSPEHGWSDDGVTVLGRSYEKTEHVFAQAGFVFIVLFVCSGLSLTAVALLVGSGSPEGALRAVGLAGFVGLVVSTTGIGVSCVGFGCWSYRHSRSLRTSMDDPQTALRDPLWLVFVFFSTGSELNEYEWWVQRAWRWSLFGLVWLVPITRLTLDKLR